MTSEQSGGPLHNPDAGAHLHPGPRDQGGHGGMASRELARHAADGDGEPAESDDGTRGPADR